MTPLCDLANKYGSDKCPEIKHSYTPVYYELFKDKRETFKKILEIGVGCPMSMPRRVRNRPQYRTGASLFMWEEFFPNAQIYAIDVLPECIFKKGRIESFLLDQYKKEDLLGLIEKIGTDIDLVVDDGSHVPEHQVFSCLTLMPLLKKDVFYIIEDVKQLEITEQLKDYSVTYNRFRHKAGFDDRLLIIKNK